MKRPFLAVVVVSGLGGLLPWNLLGRAYVTMQLVCLAVLMVCFLGYVLSRIWRRG